MTWFRFKGLESYQTYSYKSAITHHFKRTGNALLKPAIKRAVKIISYIIYPWKFINYGLFSHCQSKSLFIILYTLGRNRRSINLLSNQIVELNTRTKTSDLFKHLYFLSDLERCWHKLNVSTKNTRPLVVSVGPGHCFLNLLA